MFRYFLQKICNRKYNVLYVIILHIICRDPHFKMLICCCCVSDEPCLGDKSIFCQVEVLAQYCSIPGYHKMCCESCNRKSGFSTVSPDLHPPFSWLPDFTFPSIPQTSPAPTRQTSASLTTAAPLLHTTKASVRRARPTRPDLTSAITSPKPDEASSLRAPTVQNSTSSLPPELTVNSTSHPAAQNQNRTVDSVPNIRRKREDAVGDQTDTVDMNSPVTWSPDGATNILFISKIILKTTCICSKHRWRWSLNYIWKKIVWKSPPPVNACCFKDFSIFLLEHKVYFTSVTSHVWMQSRDWLPQKSWMSSGPSTALPTILCFIWT